MGHRDTAWLQALNPQQREAATWGSRASDGRFESAPLLVIAGAGTGKTATLAHRVAHLVLEGVDPQRILLLTFSRRAAQEMTERAGRLLARSLSGDSGALASAAGSQAMVRLNWAGTFHAIGARLLRLHARRIGLDPAFGVLDRGDSADLLDMVRNEAGLSTTHKRFPRKDTCLSIYSLRVNTGWPLERVLHDSFPWCEQWEPQLRDLFGRYVARKQQHGVLDYDDLLLWWDAAMQEPALAEAIAARFDHVLVDEYQDTNALQARLLHALRPGGRGLTVVGDDAQSIYSFRAADVENILQFPQRFSPAAHRVTLTTNYRSLQPVLDAANALLQDADRQYPKTLVSARTAADTRVTTGGPPGARPRLVTVLDEQDQAARVVDAVLARRETGVALKRQAVLFRSAQHSSLLEIELARRDVPFVKYGGLKFIEAAHIKDLLAVLRWIDQPSHGIAAFRALQLLDGMGPAHAQRVLDAMARQRDRGFAALRDIAVPAATRAQWPVLVELLVELSAPQARWTGQLERVRQWYLPFLQQRFDDAGVRAADLEMLATLAAQFGSRDRFLTELTLDPPSASGDLSGPPLRDEDYLILSTVHSAKGQEWDSVYVIHMADGSFPNEFATGKASAIEEERRLLYVAMTRARDNLQLFEPQRYYVTQQPRLGDTYVHGARSRFLTDAVMAHLDRGEEPAASGSESRPAPGDGTGALGGGVDGRRAVDAVSPPSDARQFDLSERMRRMW